MKERSFIGIYVKAFSPILLKMGSVVECLTWVRVSQVSLRCGP